MLVELKICALVEKKNTFSNVWRASSFVYHHKNVNILILHYANSQSNVLH